MKPEKVPIIFTKYFFFHFQFSCLLHTHTQTRSQIFISKEMAITQEASNRISPQARMEGLLGMFERYHLIILSMRFAWRTFRWISTKASHYCWWCYYATNSWTSKTWLYILLEYGLWGRLSVSSSLSGEYFYYIDGCFFCKKKLLINIKS